MVAVLQFLVVVIGMATLTPMMIACAVRVCEPTFGTQVRSPQGNSVQIGRA